MICLATPCFNAQLGQQWLRHPVSFPALRLACRSPALVRHDKNAKRLSLIRSAGESGDAATAAETGQSAGKQLEETVFYEGSGAPAELVMSLVLGATLVYLPLTMASIGRRLWVSYKFTNRRLIVITKSPIFQREVQVEYKQIKEIRTAPRAFGLWGDMVIFLKDGSRLELVGLERCLELRDYILGQMDY